MMAAHAVFSVFGVLKIPTPAEPDVAAILKAAKTGAVITYEDHNVKTGIAGTVAKIICGNQVNCKVLFKGVEKYGASMLPERLYVQQGLDEESLKNDIVNLLNNKKENHYANSKNWICSVYLGILGW